MTLMTWNEGLSVGNDHMDNQRKDIMQLMNMLIQYQSNIASGLTTDLFVILRKLRTNLARHFIEEEYLLKQNDCPWFEEHAVDHAQIISKLSETDAMESKEIFDQKIPILQNLLESHLSVHDVVCRGYFSV